MRLSEIGDKEIIDLKDGRKHGKLWDAEMLFDEKTGCISALIVPHPDYNSFFHANKEMIQLPWSCIIKIGEDIIILQSPM